MSKIKVKKALYRILSEDLKRMEKFRKHQHGAEKWYKENKSKVEKAINDA